MKSFFTVALLAAAADASAKYGGQSHHGSYTKVDYVPHTKVVQPAKKSEQASVAAKSDYNKKSTNDWDAWGRDQDLEIDESYGKTSAKSYRAESYDEWDNQDNDKWGGQGWGRDFDKKGASSNQYDASKSANSSKNYSASADTDEASWKGGAQMSGYDNDAWAKQAYGEDTDNRWGKSYDSVEANNYNNEHYAREVRADDDQWAENRHGYGEGKQDQYGQAASASAATGYNTDFKKASKDGASNYWGGDSNSWDAYGRDQDFHEKVSYDDTYAKSYEAESYDEWDNRDADKWGGQAWGSDQDVYGASSYGAKASASKASKAGYGKSTGHHGGAHGAHGAYGKGYANQGQVWKGASNQKTASANGYDNDAWAKQAYGEDQDARWGKSYDSVKARSYDNKKYARWLQADDDQWAENYDRYNDQDGTKYGKAASVWTKDGGHGGYGHGYGGETDAASVQGDAAYAGKSGSQWDAWGRDQDLEIDESYEQTWAKSYDAESYDEWDNKDADKWGAQAWGRDNDVYGASSYGANASAGDAVAKAYGGSKTYGKTTHGGYGSPHGAYGKHGGYAKKTYDTKSYAGKQDAQDYQASAATSASTAATDNDAWQKSAYGADTDSRWGKSYDFVKADEYDDEQYARKVRADDDQWAEDYDIWAAADRSQWGAAASVKKSSPQVKKTTYTPHVTHKSYGHDSYGHDSHGKDSYGQSAGYGSGYGAKDVGYGYGAGASAGYGNNNYKW